MNYDSPRPYATRVFLPGSCRTSRHFPIREIPGNDSLYTRMATQPLYKENQIDPELEHKAKKVADKLSETINVIANEPSLAFFRIQEHVRKTLPQLVDQKHEVEDIQARVQGACFDAEYATNAVRSMQSSAIHFQNIQDLLKNAMFMKQQITYADKRKQGKSSPTASPTSDVERGITQSTTSNSKSTDSLLDKAGNNQNERINIPKESLEDSQESQEVEKYMSNPNQNVTVQ
ncbi:unnamed protein product [Lymnaea stagnalis]|uniref:BLOC-1-related complex subunit 8 n=1 Tax=Lymnaea stagnalis TaxID=6523 RepID=A0AAV2GZX8_LYMST